VRAIEPPYLAEFEPVHPCRRFETRHCPAIFDGVCGDRLPCYRFEVTEEDAEVVWLPEIEGR
jgi:hypothetical protein